MSEIMKPISFIDLLEMSLKDYYTKEKIMEIPKKDFFTNNNENISMYYNNEFLRFPLGPAAGPHTQLAQNILAAYLTGSRFFELKTVQVIDGKDMQDMISRPCIEMKNVGYNVEWSTELTVEEAKEEYIKASILLQVFSKELEISDIKDFIFNISVGYDLEGIKSKKISDFIDDLKDAKETKVYKECIDILKKNIEKFKNFKLKDIENISPIISNFVTLSTMHGAKPEEILDIATYLVVDKKINTYIKCNPTLLGYDNIREILDNLGYMDIKLKIDDFDHDLKFDKAVELVSKLKELGKENNLNVGIKLTNTLPVYNTRNIMQGESMYLSGKPLYPIAMGVANKFASYFNGNIHMSISGGIDKNNILEVLKTGIAPVTFSTLLLKPSGYINTKELVERLYNEQLSFEKIDLNSIEELANKAKEDKNYKNKGDGKILEDILPTFDCFKFNCGICVDVCPNRANLRINDEHFNAPYQILHIEDRCNECGNCHTFCPKGGFPYFKKVSLFTDKVEFESSKNPGFVKVDNNKFKIRDEFDNSYIYEVNFDKIDDNKKNMEVFLETLLKEYPYYFNQPI